jgi:hypothetical protein
MTMFTLVFDEKDDDHLVAMIINNEQGKSMEISPFRLQIVASQAIVDLAIQLQNGVKPKQVHGAKDGMEPGLKTAFEIAAENVKKFKDKLGG